MYVGMCVCVCVCMCVCEHWESKSRISFSFFLELNDMCNDYFVLKKNNRNVSKYLDDGVCISLSFLLLPFCIIGSQSICPLKKFVD